MDILRGSLGLVFFLGVAWLLSSHRSRFPWRLVIGGVVTQLVFAGLLLETEAGRDVFAWLADQVQALISAAQPGAEMVFGAIANPQAMSEVFGSDPSDGAFVLGLAGSGLIVIIFFSALMSILYHLGVMQLFVWLLARVLSALLGVSGAEAMAMAANVFVGQTEAPLVVRPYISGMTRSELNAMMTGGFATVAGSVMAVYMGLVGPEYAPHLIAASVMSAPAAFVIAKIMQPETETSQTAGAVPLRIDRTASNVLEAATAGTSDGLKLWLNVMAMLIAFVALVSLMDMPLGWLGEQIGLEGGLSLGRVLGWVFAPVAWLMGVNGWGECQLFGELLGIKIALNDFVAFQQLTTMLPEGTNAGVHFAEPRHAAMAAYALCGFANFASIGIQIGGISPLAPERRPELAQLAFRAMLGGAMASWMTATVAGMLLE
ncbi:MAG: nucleoside transporter [Planctomycetota bacterium]|nr:MAG: nucleoside transporter [Planctomycetota bacterium]